MGFAPTTDQQWHAYRELVAFFGNDLEVEDLMELSDEALFQLIDLINMAIYGKALSRR